MKKIALAIDGNHISAHFGRCPSYLFVEFEGQEIKSRVEIPNPGHERGSIPNFIHSHGAEAIVCGGMGYRAQQFFTDFGITPIMGIQGTIEEVLQKLQTDSLNEGDSTCAPGDGKEYGVPRSDNDHF